MPKCPICRGDLKDLDENNWQCSDCGETIPRKYALDSKIPCCDPLNPCK
jgi:tRNA(Ile2) C34 agmatinyltransferase TiaS